MRLKNEPITGLILAGGASSRLQEVVTDKGLLPWQGKPFVAHVLEKLRPQVDHVAISANRHLEQYKLLDIPVWPDQKEKEWETFPGPLAGILTGLNHCPLGWLTVVPCDAPLLPSELVEKLHTAALQTNSLIAFACTRMSCDGALKNTSIQNNAMKDHPVFALIHHTLKDSLSAYLHSGERKILYWMYQHAYTRVLFEDSLPFMTNINTAIDWAKFNKLTKMNYPL